MVKSNRNGQAATLSTEQLDALADELGPSTRAVFSTCKYTADCINEALKLKWENIPKPRSFASQSVERTTNKQVDMD